ncbi:MAG: hypothetical protein KGI70_00675 [Patescibacteria group bacterium]|nr:hypothetical protein [Patescibacteria group bacterium]
MDTHFKEQISNAYEALLDALTFVSTHDKADDTKHVDEHARDILKHHPECPDVVRNTVRTCEDFKWLSAVFKIGTKHVRISTTGEEEVLRDAA